MKKVIDVYASMFNIESHDYADQRSKLLGPNAHVFVKNYNVDNLSEQTLQSLEPLVCSDEFTPEKIRNVSIQAAALCQWIQSVYDYGMAVNEKKKED